MWTASSSPPPTSCNWIPTADPAAGVGYGDAVIIPKRLWSQVEDGSVTVAFRRWRRPSVKTGGTLQTPVGVLSIDAVDPIDPAAISDNDATAAGHATADDVRTELSQRTEGTDYLIRFHRIGEDPRIALRNDTDLSDDDVAEISRRLARYDTAGSRGPWTTLALDLIAANPGRRAPDLAVEMTRLTGTEWETQPFKTDIRKLKALGLTESLQVGYRLSPRGETYLGRISKAGGNPSASLARLPRNQDNPVPKPSGH